MIAFYVDRFSISEIGGVKSYLKRIIQALNSIDVETCILTQKTKENQNREESIENIRVIRFDCGDFVDRLNEFEKKSDEERQSVVTKIFNKNDLENTSLKLAKELNDFIKEYQPKSIHVHNSYFLAPYALYFLKQNFNNNYNNFYFWSHSPSLNLILPSGQKSKLYNALSSFQNLFKEIYAVSKAVQNNLTQEGIQSKVKYFGVDLKIFSKKENPKIREKYNLSPSAFIILYAGRILREKGLDILPLLLKQLIKRDRMYSTIHFLLVGDGVYKNELINIIKKENLENNFHFGLSINDNDLVEYYSIADCFILPSMREGLGLSLLEAMSCSCATIASDLPGIRELITHTQDGILIPLDNELEYIRWISTFFSNKKLKQNLGSAARKMVEEKFNFQNHLDFFIKRFVK